MAQRYEAKFYQLEKPGRQTLFRDLDSGGGNDRSRAALSAQYHLDTSLVGCHSLYKHAWRYSCCWALLFTEWQQLEKHKRPPNLPVSCLTCFSLTQLVKILFYYYVPEDTFLNYVFLEWFYIAFLAFGTSN